MENEITKAIIGLIITVLIGGFVKLYFDYKSAVMENIWEKRLEAYMKFCKATDLFPMYPSRVREAIWKDVYATTLKFKEWYFEGYGLVLHSALRDEYFSLQRFLNKELKEKENSEEKIGEEKYEEIRRKCSAMRTRMINTLELRIDPIWPSLTKKESGRDEINTRNAR